jgi:two-component system, chemotaxis family, sensor kinase CheA
VSREEFRRLFEDESRARLDAIARHAMALEAGDPPAEALDAMFRDAHTLKGGAAVVGLEAVAARLHAFEQLLDELRARRRALTPEIVDHLLREADGLRALILGGPAPPREEPGPEPAPHPVLASRPAVPAPAEPGGGDTVAVPVRRLDELVRLVGESTAAQLRVGRLIEERLAGDPAAADEYHRLARVLGDLRERTMRARMVTLATIAAPLQRTVRDVARARGRAVAWELAGGETEVDRHVLETLRDPLVALVRNAVDHGIEDPPERRARGKPAEGTVRVQGVQLGSDVVISVADDGAGIDFDAVRTATGRHGATDADLLAALFEPGVTTAAEVTEVSGRGVGLDAVRDAVEGLRGRVEVHAAQGAGTEFRITVPMTLAALRCVLVEAAGRRFALPLHAAAVLVQATGDTLTRAEGRPAVRVGPEAVALADLAEVLDLAPARAADGPAVVVATPHGRLALRVDALIGRREVVVQDLGRVLPRLPLVGGASVEPDGTLLLVLDPGALVARARSQVLARPAAPRRLGAGGEPEPAARPHRAARLLVVDDALMVRELERSILERAGYAVRVAADGAEALAMLRREPADLVLTDLEMPGLDGFALTRAIRADAGLAGIPVLVLSGRESADERRRAHEAGANEFLFKSGFDEHALLRAVRHHLARADTTTP